MPVYLLTDDLVFPDPNQSDESGLLAVGGDLRADRLLLAYEQGIFPWYSDDQPLMWWSPDPRCVLRPKRVRISKSMKAVMKKKRFRITVDTCFEDVMTACMKAKRDDDGTWINPELVASYTELHRLGVGHSVEVWEEDELVGGLYGLSLGDMFFGESMFTSVSNASKLAFIHLCRGLEEWGFSWIDCQIENPHLTTLGAVTMERSKFLEHLRQGLTVATRKGPWTTTFPEVS